MAVQLGVRFFIEGVTESRDVNENARNLTEASEVRMLVKISHMLTHSFLWTATMPLTFHNFMKKQVVCYLTLAICSRFTTYIWDLTYRATLLSQVRG